MHLHLAGSYSEGVPSSLIPLLVVVVFFSPESPNELRTHTNAPESIRTVLDSVTMSKNALRGQNFEPFKTLAPNSRLTKELQELTPDY